MNRSRKQAHPMTVEWSTNCAFGGHADAVRGAATLPTGGWRSNMAAILLRTAPFSQRAKPLPVVVGDAGWRNQLRVWSRRPAAQEPGLRRYGPRRLDPTHRELVADTRIRWRQWNARRLWKVPPLLKTRSDCARVPTTSHSPGGGLTRNDEPAGRVPVILSKRSFNLLWFTGLPATGWESGWHVSIKAPADPERAPARSLRRGQPSSGRGCFHSRPIRSTGIRCRS